jgi:hypothetical protein
MRQYGGAKLDADERSNLEADLRSGIFPRASNLAIMAPLPARYGPRR